MDKDSDLKSEFQDAAYPKGYDAHPFSLMGGTTVSQIAQTTPILEPGWLNISKDPDPPATDYWTSNDALAYAGEIISDKSPEEIKEFMIESIEGISDGELSSMISKISPSEDLSRDDIINVIENMPLDEIQDNAKNLIELSNEYDPSEMDFDLKYAPGEDAPSTVTETADPLASKEPTYTTSEEPAYTTQENLDIAIKIKGLIERADHFTMEEAYEIWEEKHGQAPTQFELEENYYKTRLSDYNTAQIGLDIMDKNAVDPYKLTGIMPDDLNERIKEMEMERSTYDLAQEYGNNTAKLCLEDMSYHFPNLEEYDRDYVCSVIDERVELAQDHNAQKALENSATDFSTAQPVLIAALDIKP